MAGNSVWERMDKLIEHGFTYENLLEEIMHALSTHEATEIFNHIERMHGIGEEEEEEEIEEEEDWICEGTP